MNIDCPHCNQEITITHEHAGIEINCPTCQGAMRLPDLSAWQNSQALDLQNSSSHASNSSASPWPAGEQGLRVVAVGLWAELALRLFPILIKSGAKPQTLAVALGWVQMTLIVGSVARLAGLSMCTASPPQNHSRKWLVLALVCECVFLATHVILYGVIGKTQEYPEAGFLSDLASLSFIAGYASGILLMLFLADVWTGSDQSEWPRKKQSFALPVVLASIWLVTLVAGHLPPSGSPQAGAAGSIKVVLLAWIGVGLIETLGRYYWLFSFGRNLSRFSSSLKPEPN